VTDTRRKKKRADEYWYCGHCAEKLNWKAPEYPVTVIRGLCGHCDRSDVTFLTPERDFTKPGQKFKVWD
jgi:hypothetical protein